MKLSGDKEGLEELKYIKEHKLFYLKFLFKEAQTNTDNKAVFKGRNLEKYVLIYDKLKDEFIVKRES
jgi:hypothetical protein